MLWRNKLSSSGRLWLLVPVSDEWADWGRHTAAERDGKWRKQFVLTHFWAAASGGRGVTVPVRYVCGLIGVQTLPLWLCNNPFWSHYCRENSTSLASEQGKQTIKSVFKGFVKLSWSQPGSPNEWFTCHLWVNWQHSHSFVCLKMSQWLSVNLNLVYYQAVWGLYKERETVDVSLEVALLSKLCSSIFVATVYVSPVSAWQSSRAQSQHREEMFFFPIWWWKTWACHAGADKLDPNAGDGWQEVQRDEVSFRGGTRRNIKKTQQMTWQRIKTGRKYKLNQRGDEGLGLL